jgi:PhoPQ-activated pathogenicity-related protein
MAAVQVHFRTVIALAAWISVLIAGPAASSAQDSPLDRYVRQPDPAYRWKVVQTTGGNPARTHVVHLTSQSWRTTKDVDKPTWEHYLVIVEPQKVVSNKAFLMIGGGSNDRPAPERADPVVTQIAEATHSIVAELRMIPNQALIFHGDGKSRKEDDLIAYCWDQYLKTKDPTWLPRLPMVKSVVRAMDCIQELMGSEQGGNHPIEKFVISGGSKRGWTTWMTGVADPRVEAIVPIVIDVLNVETSMRNHVGAYGFWANAIGDYYAHGIMQRTGDPKLQELYQIVDPYFHRDRLTMPKFIVNASGDQFFCPDSSKFYFDDLKGEKHLRYVPNADHSLKGSDAVESIAAFYQLILDGKPRPKLSWSFEPNGAIRMKSDRAPKQVLLWQATNPKARDFRVDTIGKAFVSTELGQAADGGFVATLQAPAQGWTASFIEATFDVGGKLPLKLTTAVRVLPDTLPYADVDPRKAPYEASRGN